MGGTTSEALSTALMYNIRFTRGHVLF